MCSYTYVRTWPAIVLLSLALDWVSSGPLIAQVVPPASSNPSPTKAQQLEVALQQRQLADRFVKLEELFLRMSELESTTNPTRSGLLQQAAKMSKELALAQRLSSASDALDKRMFSRAIEEQKFGRESLAKLLELLQSENREERVRDQRKRIEQMIKEIQRMQRIQQSLRGRTENGLDTQEAAKDQTDLSQQAQKTLDELKSEAEADEKKNAAKTEDSKPTSQDNANKPQDAKPQDAKPQDAKPQDTKAQDTKAQDTKAQDKKPEGSPSQDQSKESSPDPSQDSPSKPSPAPSDKSQGSSDEPSPDDPSQEDKNSTPKSREENARQRLKSAQEQMDQAKKGLDEKKREDAVRRQREAEKELKAAAEELEKILRQLREEEVERSLVALDARFRKMLTAQNAVLEETRLVNVLQADQREIQLVTRTSKLAVEERKILVEGQRALLLLQDEGSSMAFPEAVVQLVADIQSVVDRLSASDPGALTIGIEEEIVLSLEELIEALSQAKKKQEEEKQQAQQQQGQENAGEQEKPLVGALSELRLVKTLQLRINSRTRLLSSKLVDPKDAVGQAKDADLRKQLKELAERQDKIQGVTRDIYLKLNEQ